MKELQSSRRKMVEIGNYEFQRYEHHKRVFKIIGYNGGRLAFECNHQQYNWREAGFKWAEVVACTGAIVGKGIGTQ